jgi:uncharacterized iron-regulated membrane protein
MTQNRLVKPLLLAIGMPLLYLADVSPQAPWGLTLVRDAHAIIGRPLSPISVAGVARRTTYRAVAYGSTATAAATSATAQQQAATAQQQSATAQQQAAAAQQPAAAGQKPPAQAAAPAGTPAVGSIVKTLPAGCVQEAKGGVEYQRCGNVYYRAAFQGNSLVYVVQQP